MTKNSRIACALLFSVSLGCSSDKAAPGPAGGLDASSLGDVTAAQNGDGSANNGNPLDTGLPNDASSIPQPDGSGGTPTYGSSACARCVATPCSGELTACTGDPDCTTYLACLDACPIDPTGAVSGACAQACPTGSSTSGAATEQQLEVCIAAAESQCTACGADAGAAGTILNQQCSTPTSYANSCDLCSKTHCCVSDATCQADPECGAYLNCILPCNTGAPADDAGTEGGTDAETLDGEAADGASDGGGAPLSPGACEEACAQQYPNGRADWAAFSACTTVYCSGPNDCNGMPTACLQCTTSQCASEYVDYFGSADGFALSFCISGCDPTDTTCQGECYEGFPDALAGATTLNECALEQCTACQAP